MDIDEFGASVKDVEPAINLNFALQALWWDRHGDWNGHTNACRPTNLTRPRLGSTPICTAKKAMFNAAYLYGALGSLWRLASVTQSGQRLPRHC